MSRITLSIIVDSAAVVSDYDNVKILDSAAVVGDYADDDDLMSLIKLFKIFDSVAVTGN